MFISSKSVDRELRNYVQSCSGCSLVNCASFPSTLAQLAVEAWVHHLACWVKKTAYSSGCEGVESKSIT